MSGSTDTDNAYLDRLLQHAQQMSEAHDLTQHTARRAKELFQLDDAIGATTRHLPPAEIEAEARPTPRRGLRV